MLRRLTKRRFNWHWLNKHFSHMFTRLKIHHHFSIFTNFVPNYGETCTRQCYWFLVNSMTWRHITVKLLEPARGYLARSLRRFVWHARRHFETFIFWPTLQWIIMSCSCLIFFFLGGGEGGGVFVSKSTDSWLTFLSWPWGVSCGNRHIDR